MSSVYDEPPKRGKGSKAAKKRQSDVTKVRHLGDCSDMQSSEEGDSDSGGKGKKRKTEPVSSSSMSYRLTLQKKRRTSKADDVGYLWSIAANVQLPPDEARVVELKKIVVACGVRKQWSKELADCETVSCLPIQCNLTRSATIADLTSPTLTHISWHERHTHTWEGQDSKGETRARCGD
jgi:hypothetical protein